MELEQIPDHPDIRMMEMYGTLNPEEADFTPTCPICNQECETLYADRSGEVIGCDMCIEHFDAYDYLWEKVEDERQENEE